MTAFFHNMFRSRGVVSGCIAIGIVALIALGCSCNKALENIANEANKAAVNAQKNANSASSNADVTTPTDLQVENLVKETMEKFADCVDADDFTAMWNYASPDFQSTYTPAQLRTAFASYVKAKRQVLPILRKVDMTDAVPNKPPVVEDRLNLKILKSSGTFPTKPFKVRYETEYVWRDGEWKLLTFVVNIP